MQNDHATLSELRSEIAKMPSELPLLFRTESGKTGSGYHIVELKRADIESVDCGGRLSRWREVHLQIQDGHEGETLTAGKVSNILGQCSAKLDGIDDATLVVEFAPGNVGLSRFFTGTPELKDDHLEVPMIAENAVCKPSLDWEVSPGSGRCCG